jgi:DNA-binding NarL/FixJ family response regulator
MDITMPVLNGIEVTRRMTQEGSATRVIALSMHADRQFVTEMLKAGAMGYLLKDSAPRELISAIESVLGGKVYLSPKAAEVVDDARGRRDREENTFAVLTPREREVLQLLAEGKSTKEIAHTLLVSARTIETHRAQIMDKLGIRNVAGLTKYAIRQGLTPPEK